MLFLVAFNFVHTKKLSLLSSSFPPLKTIFRGELYDQYYRLDLLQSILKVFLGIMDLDIDRKTQLLYLKR